MQKSLALVLVGSLSLIGCSKDAKKRMGLYSEKTVYVEDTTKIKDLEARNAELEAEIGRIREKIKIDPKAVIPDESGTGTTTTNGGDAAKGGVLSEGGKADPITEAKIAEALNKALENEILKEMPVTYIEANYKSELSKASKRVIDRLLDNRAGILCLLGKVKASIDLRQVNSIVVAGSTHFTDFIAALSVSERDTVSAAVSSLLNKVHASYLVESKKPGFDVVVFWNSNIRTLANDSYADFKVNNASFYAKFQAEVANYQADTATERHAVQEAFLALSQQLNLTDIAEASGFGSETVADVAFKDSNFLQGLGHEFLKALAKDLAGSLAKP